MTREIEKEFAKNPIRVPMEADPSGVAFPTASITNNYNGPVVPVHGDNAQLAWGNETANQTQTHDIAPGFEALAKVLAGLLTGLAGLGLTDADADEAKVTAETVLSEVVKPKPDRGIIKRGATMIKGLLAPVATGIGTAVSAESAEFAKTVIEGLGSSVRF